MDDIQAEIEALERAGAWRLRLVDENASDTVSIQAAERLERLADDLRQTPHQAIWGELCALTNWLAESDLISDYADLAGRYRARIGNGEFPADSAEYLQALLAIARSLV